MSKWEVSSILRLDDFLSFHREFECMYPSITITIPSTGSNLFLTTILGLDVETSAVLGTGVEKLWEIILNAARRIVNGQPSVFEYTT